MDATKTSAPTGAALAELSIEEACKAWMLYFWLLFQGRRTRAPLRASRKLARAMDAYLESKADYLTHFGTETLAAFKWHRVKLRFLSFLLGFLKITASESRSSDEIAKIVTRIQGGLYAPKGEFLVAGHKQVQEFLSSLQLEALPILADVKERGIYVNLTESRDLLAPDVESLPTQVLVALAAFLIESLKGELVLLTR